MSSILSQGLIVLGLVIQAISVMYSGYRYCEPIKKLKEKELEKMGEELSKRIKGERIDWLIITTLLFTGLVFQGIAEFVR